MPLKKILNFVLLSSLLVFSGCKPGGQAEATETPLSPEAVFTAAALTAQVRMTELIASTPSPQPATPTQTIAAATVTSTVSSAGAAPSLTLPPAVPGADKVEFVADLTIPDGTVFSPGEKFTKTWRLMNAGTATWTTAYTLVFFSGEQMGGAASTSLPLEVPSGQTLDLSVQLTAPAQAGSYTGYWILRNAAGRNFGLGPNADGPFYVQINVSGTAATGTPQTGTPSASSTPGGDTVSGVTLGVDAATVQQACPYTFTFSGRFTLNKTATVTYRLEADTSFPINLPGATTTSLNAGTHEVTYTLEFSDSVTGTARLHVTAPQDVNSDPVSISLTCN